VSKHYIVVHYHELWLKGGNRRFFLGKLITALRRSLEDLGLAKLHCPGDRVLLELADGAPVEPVLERVGRVLGVANFAVAREIPRDDADLELRTICQAAWDEVEGAEFQSFAVRVKRADKSFPLRTSEIEPIVGRHILEKLRAAGRDVRVKLIELTLAFASFSADQKQRGAVVGAHRRDCVRQRMHFIRKQFPIRRLVNIEAVRAIDVQVADNFFTDRFRLGFRHRRGHRSGRGRRARRR